MRKKAGCYVRSVKRADGLIERVQARLGCKSSLRIFILAFIDKTRNEARLAYERFLKKATLVEEVREFVYKVLHGLWPSQQPTAAT